ncbi:MAG: 50S ribosomal protein L32 [Planctomycetes bacterium]|nr:50S ribosomal protein L32 [Planctomycetota bacterium]
MAVPKRKISKARGRKRRSHNAVSPIQLAYCPQCGTAVPTHVVCPNCGYYQGRTVVESEE